MNNRDPRTTNHLLLPIATPDTCQEVCRHARALARGLDGRVTLLHVLDRNRRPNQPVIPIDPLEWHLRKIDAQTHLDALAASFRNHGVAAEAVVLEGQTIENIVDHCHRQQVTVVIMTRPRQGEGRVGRVVQELLQRTGSSIFLVPPPSDLEHFADSGADSDEVRYRTLLVPLDGSTRAECVLTTATALARGHGGRLLLGHVVKKPEIPRRTPPSEGDLELVRQLTDRNRQEVKRYLEELAGRLDVDSEICLRSDSHVAGSLHELVTEGGVDLVVLSAHGYSGEVYSGEVRWPVGSVTSHFLAYGTTPLLMIQDSQTQQAWKPQERVTVEQWG